MELLPRSEDARGKLAPPGRGAGPSGFASGHSPSAGAAGRSGGAGGLGVHGRAAEPAPPQASQGPSAHDATPLDKGWKDGKVIDKSLDGKKLAAQLRKPAR